MLNTHELLKQQQELDEQIKQEKLAKEEALFKARFGIVSNAEASPPATPTTSSDAENLESTPPAPSQDNAPTNETPTQQGGTGQDGEQPESGNAGSVKKRGNKT